MVPEAKIVKLIEIYFYVCERYEKDLKYQCQRFSANDEPILTDQEIMTIYLYTIHEEQRFKIKQIYEFANAYLRSWFPTLGSYSGFNNRLNRLSEAFRMLSLTLIEQHRPADCCLNQSLLDSMPVITCSGKRTPRVAKSLVDKGVCSSKGLYYNGLKLHALGFTRKNKLPFPEQLIITPASVNDLQVFKQAWSGLSNRQFLGDKIYYNNDYFNQLALEKNSYMLTPVKAIKGQTKWEKQFNKAADELYSKAVSSVRQPIEAFFNWLIEKTDFQRASKVRSVKGLLVHVFGKIAAAFIYLIFNS
ncbi:MAG: transposase [Bacteroidales bacterium]|nr:transposase [Bacteroidales bacterium]